MQFEIDSVFPYPREVVVDALLDAEGQANLYQSLGYLSWVEQSRTEEADGGLHRILKVQPKVQLPSFVRSALGDVSSYTESQIWAPDRSSYAWDADFDLSDRIEMRGRCVFEPAQIDGVEGCRRRIDGDLSVKVPLVGGKIASFLLEETVRTQTAAAEALIQLLARG